jgi:DNA-binding transcriptional LysR family regulator
MTAVEHHPYRHPWLGVEVRHLATLIAVARTQSFRQAAAELGYVQSAVSQQIAALERVVGTRLVDRRRGHRVVSLTPAGELLLERSVGIIGQLRAARIDLSVTDDSHGAVVRLAVACDAAQSVLARLLPHVTQELPAIRLHVTETSDERDLVSQLECGTADLAVGAAPAAAGLASATLLHDPFVVLVAQGSPLAAKGSALSLADLADERLIIPASAFSHAQLGTAGLRLERAVRVPMAAAVSPLVAGGLGVGLVPRSAAVDAESDVISLSTAGLIAPRHVVLCWHPRRKRTALLESFSRAALSAFQDEDVAPALPLAA